MFFLKCFYGLIVPQVIYLYADLVLFTLIIAQYDPVKARQVGAAGRDDHYPA
jgi:hypothetical protein